MFIQSHATTPNVMASINTIVSPIQYDYRACNLESLQQFYPLAMSILLERPKILRFRLKLTAEILLDITEFSLCSEAELRDI